MFQTEEHAVKITHCSLNAENAGKDEHATGMTLSFKGMFDSSVLDYFDPKLKKLIFRKQAAGDQMDLAKKNEGLVALNYPKLEPFAWIEKFTGYEGNVSAPGLGLTDPIQIVDATLHSIKFRGVDGGSVELSGKLYFNPDIDEVGPIASLMKEEALLTLTPPSKQAAEQE
jgi:hypothetical protein